MSEIDHIHDPGTVRRDVGVATVRKGKRGGKMKGAEELDSHSMNIGAAVEVLQRVAGVREVANEAATEGVGEVGGGLGGVFHAMGGDQGISEEVHKVKGKVGGEVVAEGTPVNSRETRCLMQSFRASGEVEAALKEGMGVILVGIAPESFGQQLSEVR